MCPQCQTSGITDTNEQLRVNEKLGFCYVADALDKFLHYQTRYETK